MLNYELNIKKFKGDVVKVELESVALRDYFADEDTVEIVCEHNGSYDLYVDESIDVVTKHRRDVYPSGMYYVGDRDTTTIKSVDKGNNKFTFLGEKYMRLIPDNISVIVENNVVYLLFHFSLWHYFRSWDSGNITLYAKFIGSDNVAHEKVFKRCIYENDNELKWRYDKEDIDIDEFMCCVFKNDYYEFVGYAELNNVDEKYQQVNEVPETACFTDEVFIKKGVNFSGCPKWELYEKVCAEGSLGGVTFRRINWKWQDIDEMSVYVNRFTTSLPIPLSAMDELNIHKENLIQTQFVQEEVRKAKNPPVEMEKFVYHPVFKVQDKEHPNGWSYRTINTIKFNLHFREREEDGWMVKTDGLWNGMNVIEPKKFFSYRNIGTDTDVEGRQSDLLSYLGFHDSDIKYQKSRLKKSFLRLSFFDSDNPANQNLLCYSTIYLDSGKLFARMMRHSCGSEIYFKSGSTLPPVLYTDIKVDREPLLNSVTNEEIEDYRLSSQITVSSSLLSDASSEGFYLYIWADNDNGAVPEDIYMKVEFNHAGYGRTIPFMLPYYGEGENQTGAKSYEDVMNDWKNGNGYGIRLYQKYSYIKFKYCHDRENGRHVYYPDDTVYGLGSFNDNTPDELELNLYEAKVNFGD